MVAGLTVVAAAAEAQLVVDLRVGATASSNLVTDAVIDELTARPAIAPTFGAALGTRLDSLSTVYLHGAWSRGDVERHESGAARKIVSLTTWQAGVELQRRVIPLVMAHATAGVLKYAPSAVGRAATLFRGDAPAVPTLGIGASISRRVGLHYQAALHVRWDIHRFTTNALRDAGFEGRRTVHRVFVGATIRREVGHATS